MKDTFIDNWRGTFFETIKKHDVFEPLKDASIKGNLGEWTKLLTGLVVDVCNELGMEASAKGHRLELLPIPRNEYLSLDIIAFSNQGKRWRFPSAIFELENSYKDDQVAYSLWKLLCVRSEFRIVFCYRKDNEQAVKLIKFLQNDVINSMGLSERVELAGETLVIVGIKDESSRFPYGFFKWWKLDKDTGIFRTY
jgi:hypothetical protein